MRPEYDFSKGKRGALIAERGKTRISIYIDNAVLDAFRAAGEKQGRGYQTMINEALRRHVTTTTPEPLTMDQLREVLREEMPEVLRELTRNKRAGAKKRRSRRAQGTRFS